MERKIKVQNDHLFKSKTQMVIYLIIFAILIYMFIYLANQDYNIQIPDNERFASDFSLVDKNNVFKYANATTVRMIASGKTGIVLFGTQNEWVNYYANIINKVAKEIGVSEIYYYDFLKNRQDNNGTYEDIVKKLENYVTYNDRGKAEIYAPSLLVVKNNEILLFDDDTAFVKGKITPSIYWNINTEGAKEQLLKEVFKEYLEG